MLGTGLARRVRVIEGETLLLFLVLYEIQKRMIQIKIPQIPISLYPYSKY